LPEAPAQSLAFVHSGHAKPAIQIRAAVHYLSVVKRTAAVIDIRRTPQEQESETP
jgi:hypothetical protein